LCAVVLAADLSSHNGIGLEEVMDPSLPLVTVPLADHPEAPVDGPGPPCARGHRREQTVPVAPGTWRNRLTEEDERRS